MLSISVIIYAQLLEFTPARRHQPTRFLSIKVEQIVAKIKGPLTIVRFGNEL
jgi:hypothetical protein